WWRGKGEASAVALYDVADFELVKKYSSLELDGDDRLIGFVEKPEHPETTLVATATYLFHRAHVPFVERYLAEGNSHDQPGRLVRAHRAVGRLRGALPREDRLPRRPRPARRARRSRRPRARALAAPGVHLPAPEPGRHRRRGERPHDDRTRPRRRHRERSALP